MHPSFSTFWLVQDETEQKTMQTLRNILVMMSPKFVLDRKWQWKMELDQNLKYVIQ